MEIITSQLRKKILERDKYTCAYCFMAFQPGFLHIDHIQPKSKGGSNRTSNLITACRNCNQQKHNRILDNPPKPNGLELEDGDLIEGGRFQYPMFSCRLSEEVQEQLKTAKLDSELSWNKFIKDMLEKYDRR